MSIFNPNQWQQQALPSLPAAQVAAQARQTTQQTYQPQNTGYTPIGGNYGLSNDTLIGMNSNANAAYQPLPTQPTIQPAIQPMQPSSVFNRRTGTYSPSVTEPVPVNYNGGQMRGVTPTGVSDAFEQFKTDFGTGSRGTMRTNNFTNPEVLTNTPAPQPVAQDTAFQPIQSTANNIQPVTAAIDNSVTNSTIPSNIPTFANDFGVTDSMIPQPTGAANTNGLFTRIGESVGEGFDALKSGFDAIGGMDTINTGMSIYQGFNQIKNANRMADLAQQTFDFNKDAWQKNFDMQKDAYQRQVDQIDSRKEFLRRK